MASTATASVRIRPATPGSVRVAWVTVRMATSAAAPVLGETLTRRRVAGAALGFAGVAIVSFHQATEANATGVLLLLGAA